MHHVHRATRVLMAPAALVLALLTLTPVPAGAAEELAVTQIRSSPFATGISLLSAAGGRPHVLTSHSGWMDESPDWSPDGRRLAFSRSMDGGRSYDLYVMRANGRGLRRLTRGGFNEAPAWSPNGNWIAYQAIDGVIRLVRPGGRGSHPVPGTRGASSPAWTPDGRLVFTYRSYIVTARADGSDRKRLVRGRDPDWSPDGRFIAYTGPDGGVYTAPAAGGKGRMIHSGSLPSWSPDGEKIAFTRWPQSEVFSVWVMNRDGSGARRIVSNARAPAWRP